MRVIKVNLPARLSSADTSITLASDEIRSQLFRELKQLDYELSEQVRQRAAGYLPDQYSVFVRTEIDTERIGTNTEFWVVDPTLSWPGGLLARRAWRLFVPVLGHLVKSTIEQRFPMLVADVLERDSRVAVLATTRTWRDPVILSLAVCVVTTLFWLVVAPAIGPALRSVW